MDLSASTFLDKFILTEFENLEDLNLSGTKFEDYSYLQNLENLTSLDLSSNAINSTSQIPTSVNLEKLTLSKNNLTDLEGLVALSGLRYLDVSDNYISQFPAKTETFSLESINLFSNQISKIDNLLTHDYLDFLDIRDNFIFTKLDDFESISYKSDLGKRECSTDDKNQSLRKCSLCIEGDKCKVQYFPTGEYKSGKAQLYTSGLMGGSGGKFKFSLVNDSTKITSAKLSSCVSGHKIGLEYSTSEGINYSFGCNKESKGFVSSKKLKIESDEFLAKISIATKKTAFRTNRVYFIKLCSNKGKCISTGKPLAEKYYNNTKNIENYIQKANENTKQVEIVGFNASSGASIDSLEVIYRRNTEVRINDS